MLCCPICARTEPLTRRPAMIFPWLTVRKGTLSSGKEKTILIVVSFLSFLGMSGRSSFFDCCVVHHVIVPLACPAIAARALKEERRFFGGWVHFCCQPIESVVRLKNFDIYRSKDMVPYCTYVIYNTVLPAKELQNCETAGNLIAIILRGAIN